MSFCVRPPARALLTVGLLLALQGCGDETSAGPDGLTVADLAGSWTATEFRYSQAAAGPEIPDVELIGDGGSVTMLLESNGRFVITITEPGGASDVLTGLLYFEEEDFLIIEIDGESGFIDFFFTRLGDDAFRLTDNVGQVEFDLDGDGSDEAVRLEIRFQRS